MLNDLAQSWLDAKAAEAAAVTHRRDLENKLASLIGVSETLEGVENVETDAGFRIKIAGRMNRKVDGDRVQDNITTLFQALLAGEMIDFAGVVGHSPRAIVEAAEAEQASADEEAAEAGVEI